MKKVRVNATQVRCITIDVYVDVESNASEEKKRKAAIDFINGSNYELNFLCSNEQDAVELCRTESVYVSLTNEEKAIPMFRCNDCDEIISIGSQLCNDCKGKTSQDCSNTNSFVHSLIDKLKNEGCDENTAECAEAEAISEEEEAENERDRYIEGLKKLPVYAAIEILAGLLGYKHLVHNPVIYATIVETAARLYPRTWTTYLDKVIDSYTK